MLLLKNIIWKLITDTFEPHQWLLNIDDIIELLNYSVFFISLSILLISLCFLVWSLYRRIRCSNDATKSIYTRRLFQWWAFSTFASGFFVYFIGFNFSGTSSSTLVYILRPIISALEMFLSKSDLIAVYDGCKSNPYYMTLFTITHASAVAVSACFAISCLGKRIQQKTRKLFWLLQSKKNHTINIFFGLNEQSFLLARKIYTEDKNNLERIIFIDYPDESKDYAHRLTFGHIFGLFSYKSVQLNKINDIKYLLFNASFNPATIKNAADISVYPEFNYIMKLNKNSNTIRMFFLSDDEDTNVKSMLNILKCDKLNKSYIKIYCRSRHNCVNNTLEIQSSEKASVSIIDDSQHSIISLKTITSQNDNNKYVAHPINFVDIDTNNSCVISDFNAMIIGFGTTGQDALRFIYEFSAFPNKDGEKSTIHCDIYDSCMSQIKANIINEIPFLATPQEEISLHNIGTDSIEFWETLKSSINSLNYIVVATGDDDRNITIASQLYEFTNQYRNNFDKFHIYIRIYKCENKLRLEQLRDYYKNNNNTDVITIFGSIEDIYTKKQIIDNSFLDDAKVFYKNYAKTYNEIFIDKQITEDWDIRHNNWADGCNNLMLGYRSLRRQENQDTSNCLHSYTKRTLLGNTIVPHSLPDFPFTQDDNTSESNKNLFNRLTNLSICEHLRWNASHLMMGYIEMPEENKETETKSCNEATKQHKYITDWRNLDTGIQRYDYIVVKTTINNFLNTSNNE